MVVSDAFPAGYLPRPSLPLHRFNEIPDADRKAVKKKRWLPREHFSRPLPHWLTYAVAENDIIKQLSENDTKKRINQDLTVKYSQPHNTINRMTGTTGTDEFTPYTMAQHWFAPGLHLDLYIAIDSERLSMEEAGQLLQDVGRMGYGRDASIGLGKFDVKDIVSRDWPAQENANAVMTLAPCAPQGQGFDDQKSWYQPFTRFGRHGDVAVHTRHRCVAIQAR